MRVQPSHPSVAARRSLVLRLLSALLLCSLLLLPVPASAQEPPAAQPLIIDADPGVDDAAALAWLLAQTQQPVELRAVTVVAGNTTVQNGVRNAALILAQSGRAGIPVYAGADRPMHRRLSSTGKLLHGPDGLWFQGGASAAGAGGPAPARPTAALDFYCAADSPRRGATLLALGPLTNVAAALKRCPERMAEFSRLVILGGGDGVGNHTPVAEYNFWQDPEAAELVFTTAPGLGLIPTVVPLNAFGQFTVTLGEALALNASPQPAARTLAPALALYICTQAGVPDCFGAPQLDAAGTAPDVAALMYALDPSLGAEQPALLKMVAKPELVRGQSVVGLTFNEKLTMIASDEEISSLIDRYLADPSFDLFAALGQIVAREPDNVRWVTDIDEARMRELFLAALNAPPANGAAQDGPQGEAVQQTPPAGERIYLPGILRPAP